MQAAKLNGSHLASTYCALAILKTVGYDLSQIDSEVLLKSMRTLQQPNGWYYFSSSFALVINLFRCLSRLLVGLLVPDPAIHLSSFCLA